MSTATPSAALDLLDPADFPDRDSLVAFLVNECGWSSKKLGVIFGRSDRQVRRIAREARESGGAARPMGAADAAAPAELAALTAAEARAMLNDYASDPYATAEEREAAIGWASIYCQASGIAELNQVKFRKGVRFPARPRDTFGQRPRVGQA